jgi:hypothetical protein
MDFASVTAITIICYLIGIACKATALDNKWIPVICGLCGAIIGALAFFNGMPNFPAHDVITAVAVGIVSGLAATGVNQITKQLGGDNK